MTWRLRALRKQRINPGFGLPVTNYILMLSAPNPEVKTMECIGSLSDFTLKDAVVGNVGFLETVLIGNPGKPPGSKSRS